LIQRQPISPTLASPSSAKPSAQHTAFDSLAAAFVFKTYGKSLIRIEKYYHQMSKD
jgi:hypothetical protein